MNVQELNIRDLRERIHEEALQRQESMLGRRMESAKLRCEQIDELTSRLQESEADRAARLDAIHELSEKLKESEADRLARLDVIHSLSDRLAESEADRAARLDVIHALEREIAALHARLQEEIQRADQEKMRADACEQGWRALEGTFAVRQARRLRLIRTMGYAIHGQPTTGD